MCASTGRRIPGIGALLLAVLLFCAGGRAQGIQAVGGDVSALQGAAAAAVLPCHLTGGTVESLTQISWARAARGGQTFRPLLTVAAAGVSGAADDRFKFVGSLGDRDASIQLSNATLADGGVYRCTFTLFPSGNHYVEMRLGVLVPPETSVVVNSAVEGEEEVALATCTAAGSSPPADVRWRLGGAAGVLRATSTATRHANGTTTTVGSLFGVPTRSVHQHAVDCVVAAAALPEEKTLPLNIQVQFAPTEVDIIKQPDSFECVTEGNPNPQVAWTRRGGPWPHPAIRAENATLRFLSMTSDLDGQYVCEASNPYGRTQAQLYVTTVPSAGACTAGWVLFSLLLLTVGVGAVWWLRRSTLNCHRQHHNQGNGTGHVMGRTKGTGSAV